MAEWTSATTKATSCIPEMKGTGGRADVTIPTAATDTRRAPRGLQRDGREQQ